jgi:hypothetical protein
MDPFAALWARPSRVELELTDDPAQRPRARKRERLQWIRWAFAQSRAGTRSGGRTGEYVDDTRLPGRAQSVTTQRPGTSSN